MIFFLTWQLLAPFPLLALGGASLTIIEFITAGSRSGIGLLRLFAFAEMMLGNPLLLISTNTGSGDSTDGSTDRRSEFLGTFFWLRNKSDEGKVWETAQETGNNQISRPPWPIQSTFLVLLENEATHIFQSNQDISGSTITTIESNAVTRYVWSWWRGDWSVRVLVFDTHIRTSSEWSSHSSIRASPAWSDMLNEWSTSRRKR